jgi:hypothetical protein
MDWFAGKVKDRSYISVRRPKITRRWNVGPLLPGFYRKRRREISEEYCSL